MPDPHAIKVIRNATQPRPSRRWLVWTLIVAGVLGLLAGLPFVVDSWRVSRIQTAKKELELALDRAAAHFGNVSDWPGWYRARLSGSDGCAAWQEFEGRWSKRLEGPLAYIVELGDSAMLRQGVTGQPLSVAPDEADMRRALADSEAVVSEARVLLEYDHLSGTPAFVDGSPVVSVSSRVRVQELLVRRVAFHARLGSFGQAHDELTLLIGLRSRMSVPTYLLDYLLTIALEYRILDAAGILVEAAALRPEIVAQIESAHARTPGNWLQVCESELAFMSQLWQIAHKDPTSETHAPGQNGKRFEWFDPSDGLEDNLGRLADHGQYFRDQAAVVDCLIQQSAAGRAGLPFPARCEEVESWRERFDSQEQSRTLGLQRLKAAHWARVQEAAGTELLQLAGDRSFPGIELRVEAGALRIQFLPSSARDLAFEKYESEEFFDAANPPLRLKPRAE